jgi:enoyl-CoA hydratase/carnithine racemase
VGELEVTAGGPVLTVTFNRPEQRNAMTWAMYEGLVRACDRADADDEIRVMVLRGAGGRAFIAGTDITQFAGFRSGQDGVDYERRISQVLDRLIAVEVPTIAAVEGYCVGGGLGIASACDLRLATPDARFGVPVARTLGNCLSARTLALLCHRLGESTTSHLLLTADLLGAEQARTLRLVAEITDDLPAATAALARRLLGHAPLTIWATKQALRRLREAGPVADEDIVARVYGSQDFHAAVAGFGGQRRPSWTGR